MAAKRSKVLIFKGPCIYRDFERKRPGRDHEVRLKQPMRRAWKESHLHFDGTDFVSSKYEGETSEGSAESNLRLDYDVDHLQESLVFYLDSEFLGRTERSMSDSTPMASDADHAQNQPDFMHNLDLQKEYQAISEASQHLLLESQAPSSDLLEDSESVGESMGGNDKRSGISTHPCTVGDVYTQSCGSPWSAPLSSSPSPPAVVETRAVGSKANPTVMMRILQLPRVCDSLLNLIQCTEKGSVVNIAFVVLQVNVVREIQVRTGQSAGQYVPLSSLLVADESKSHFKFTLWRDASSWTDKILPGDFMVATSIQITSWRGENIGQTTYKSNLYNLHQPKKPLSTEWCQLISQERLDNLISWTQQNHPYLFKSDHTKKEVVFRTIVELKDNTLVHFRGLLTTVDVSGTRKGSYTFKHEQLPKIVLSFSESPHHLIQLCLWGQQALWVKELQAGLKQVWEVMYLTVKYDNNSSSFVLHSTPKSCKRKLPETDPNAAELLSRFGGCHAKQTQKFDTIRDLYKAKYSGVAELTACVSSLTFNYVEDLPTLTREFDSDQLRTVAHKLVYVGCGTCSRPLAEDENNIYIHCANCMATNPQYKATITYCYKPFAISLSDGKEIIEGVEVKQKEALGLFRGFPARNLAFQNRKDLEDFVETVRGLLLTSKPKRFVLVCHVVVDENSYVEQRYFSLATSSS